MRLYILIILLCFCAQLFAQTPIEFSESEDLQLINSFYILKDTSNQMLLEDIIQSDRFKNSIEKVPNLGVSNATYWLKFKLKNNSTTDHLVLEFADPVTDEVNLYEISSEAEWTQQLNGEYQPFSRREYKYQNFNFDLHIPINETRTYLMKIKSGDLIVVPLLVGTPQAISRSHLIKEFIFGIYSGVILVMFLYNLFIYFTVGDKNYLYYVAYIVFVGLTQLMLQGYTYKYLWPEFPWYANQSMVLFPALSGISIILFLKNFLKMNMYVPLLSKVNNGFLLFFSIVPIIRFLNFNNLSYNMIDVGAALTSLYGLFVACYISFKGYRPAKFFLLAWTIFLVGVVVFVLRNFGILPYNNFTNYTMLLGSALEVVLLSFALADRINVLRREKEESQLESIELFKENQQILHETQTQLLRSEKMASLGQLTAGIAHEINNPINFVASNIKPLKRNIEDIIVLLGKYGQITRDSNFNEKLKEIDQLLKELDMEHLVTEISLLLKGIDEGATRTSEIVKGIKRFSHADKDELKRVDIHEGLDNTLLLLSNSLNGKIKLIKEYNDLPEIEGYPGKLNQVFMNILHNAIHAIVDKKDNKEKGVIAITTLSQVESVTISIKDNGTGMSEQVQSKIFQPLYTTKDAGVGTGLGLSIAYHIIKNHRGEIKVESEIGKGSTFSIILPIEHAKQQN